MRRLAVTTLSFAWMAAFAALSLLALLAAEDGGGAAATAFGLPPETLQSIAGRPALAGFCLGAAIVSALFATVMVCSAANPEKHLGQCAMIAEMGFGGACGLAVLTMLASFMHPVQTVAVVALVVAVLLVASLLAMRAAMDIPERSSPERPARAQLLAREAAANANVVRFPIERAAGVR